MVAVEEVVKVAAIVFPADREVISLDEKKHCLGMMNSHKDVALAGIDRTWHLSQTVVVRHCYLRPIVS